ncbi:MAG: hypothetical protein ACE5NG_19280 [bacterium]
MYGQLVDKTQRRIWGEFDKSISNDLQFDPRAVADGHGGIIVVWYEIGVGTGNGIFAQQVSRNGK